MLIMGNYNKNLELSTGDVAKYEAEVQKYDDLINGFMLGTGKDLGSRTSTEMEWFLAKAENLAYLGQNNKAIRILIGAFKYYPDSPRIRE